MKHQITSILTQITEIAFAVKTTQQMSDAKTAISKLINESKVKDTDKKVMIKTINEQKTVFSFQKYLCNALLKYEGLGMAQLEHKAPGTGEKQEATYEMETNIQ